MSTKDIAVGDAIISSELDGIKIVKGFVGIQEGCQPVVGNYFSNEQVEIHKSTIEEHWSLNIDL